MKLSFFGADQCVTGSCHCLEVNGKRLLVDCGLQQGRDELDNSDLPFAANTIDCVLVTHAHIDHSGRIPMLVRQGFKGRILTTRLTAQLLKSGGIVICRGCGNAIREFSLYRWDDRAPGQDQVRKEHDHAMDEIRYFAATVAAKEGRGGMFAGCVERGRF